jgi:hypothetical protein
MMTSEHKVWAIFWISMFAALAVGNMGCIAFCGN